MLNKTQRKLIEKELEKIISRMERLEDKQTEAEHDGDSEKADRLTKRIDSYMGELEGIDRVLTLLGYMRVTELGEDIYHPVVRLCTFAQWYARTSGDYSNPSEDPTPEQEAGWAFEDKLETMRRER